MSLTFGGATSDRVQCSLTSFASLSAWTWYGWVNLSTITAGRRFFSSEDGSSPFGGFAGRVIASGFLRVDVTRATTGTVYTTNNQAISTGAWTFVAMTFDSTASAGEVVNIYVGSPTALATECSYATTTDGSGAVTTSASANGFRLGNTALLANNLSAQGRIGPCAFFNRAMPLGEIQSHQFDPRTADGCLGLWSLGDNGTGTQTDYSGNGNNGTVTGATQSDNPPLRRRWGRKLLAATPSAATTNYTLTASGGTYAVTGTAVSFGRNIVASGGTYTVTGAAATLTVAPTVLLTPGTVYQTMRGWEVTSQAGDQEVNADLYLDEVIELGAQYGVDAIRLEIKDEWETSDGVYDWSFWDLRIPAVVLPLKAALARHGRALHLNLCYVAFGTHSGLHTTAANYADFMLAGVQYLDATYGLVPDTIEVILEPDNTSGAGVHMNTGAEIGAATKALGDLLATNGYTPGFIVPSALSMSAASTLYDSTIAVSGASAYITMLSYHRYSGVSDSNLGAILSRITADGIESGMLEWLTANAETLWADLTKANVSMWQQYVLAFPTSDNGDQLFPIISNVPTIGSRTPGLAQYFKHVRRGATRIAATSRDANVRPVAFINTDGRYAVVLHADASGTYTVGPVPAGSYYVTRSSTTAARTPLGIVTVGGSGRATLALNSGDIATLAPIEGVAAAAFEVTGTDANLEFGRTLAAGGGTYALTGTDATLTYGTASGYTLAANGGTVAVTGTAASLEFGRRLAADAGSHAVTGTDASLECGRLVSAASGTFALTGTAATLVYGQPGNYTLVANGTSYTATGFAANLLAARRITAAGTTCAVTGTAATLVPTRRVTAASGSYTLTGTAATLLYSAATSTAFTVTRESGVRYPITRQSGPRYDITREG